MKRILVYVTSSLLTFHFGITADALLGGYLHPAENVPPPAEVVAIPQPTLEAEATPSPEPEIVFGGGRLKLAPDEVHLSSDRLHYQINVRYPQVDGSDDPHIRRLNQRINELMTKQYEWPIYIVDEELRKALRTHPEVYDQVDIDYDVTSATDSILSIYFLEYSYGIGAAHSVQGSLVVNYDLVAKKELKLSDLFKPGSGYLEFLSRYCKEEFKQQGQFLLPEALAPARGTFASWNVTPNGIRFNFDACALSGCADGEREVEIRYSDLKPMLSARAMSILPISSVVQVKADH